MKKEYKELSAGKSFGKPKLKAHPAKLIYTIEED